MPFLPLFSLRIYNNSPIYSIASEWSAFTCCPVSRALRTDTMSYWALQLSGPHGSRNLGMHKWYMLNWTELDLAIRVVVNIFLAYCSPLIWVVRGFDIILIFMELNLLIFVWFLLLILSFKSEGLGFKDFMTKLRNSATSSFSLGIENSIRQKNKENTLPIYSQKFMALFLSSQWGTVYASKAQLIFAISAFIIFINAWRQLS